MPRKPPVRNVALAACAVVAEGGVAGGCANLCAVCVAQAAGAAQMVTVNVETAVFNRVGIIV